GDEVLLWGGGIYDWFDPLTLIRAVAELEKDHPRLRLVFMGLEHPNQRIPLMGAAKRAVQLAEELGVAGRSVIFNRDWVPYEERAGFLLDADIGVSTHLDHVETAFSFRTRILDYLWAGLPVVSTAGDGFAPIIEEHGLGAVVPP